VTSFRAQHKIPLTSLKLGTSKVIATIIHLQFLYLLQQMCRPSRRYVFFHSNLWAGQLVPLPDLRPATHYQVDLTGTAEKVSLSDLPDSE
jgi:hypothetical protein